VAKKDKEPQEKGEITLGMKNAELINLKREVLPSSCVSREYV
jgi:hypothetical protein